jgi:hypothetical protein
MSRMIPVLLRGGVQMLFIMNIFPLLWSLGLSFFAYQANQQTIRFVGLQNYARVLTNELAAKCTWDSLINTALFVVCTVTAQMIVGFLLAILFAKQFPLRKYLLILVLTPMMLSVVASGVFFTYYYDPTFGILSHVMNHFTDNQFILMSNKVGAVTGIVFAAWVDAFDSAATGRERLDQRPVVARNLQHAPARLELSDLIRQRFQMLAKDRRRARLVRVARTPKPLGVHRDAQLMVPAVVAPVHHEREQLGAVQLVRQRRFAKVERGGQLRTVTEAAGCYVAIRA